MRVRPHELATRVLAMSDTERDELLRAFRTETGLS